MEAAGTLRCPEGPRLAALSGFVPFRDFKDVSALEPLPAEGLLSSSFLRSSPSLPT